MENGDLLTFSITFLISISFITMLAACLCCKKKVPKNDLLGLEGMVKIKNPDENLTNGTLTVLSELNARNNNDIDAKRASNAPHRSLPDIPISERNQLDTNSDLYATVGDKVGDKPQGKSPSCMKKQISVSQHSSISQADDLSSPYARVRSSSHGYDKVRNAEHPYAQLKVNDSNGPSTSHAQSSNSVQIENGNEAVDNNLSRRGSHQSLLDAVDGRQQQIIPAASAIAGHVSASQELPYMTPPIVQTQHHFSGDSQDSSKGYTSISVREPLANIIAQTTKQNAQARRRDMTDSHYATVSDDSDEMYAAIEESNNQTDLYTSGSETYAQIQPHVVPLTVAVEINALPASITTSVANLMTAPISPPVPSTLTSLPTPSNSLITTISSPRHSIISNTDQASPIPADLLKGAHSRQASSSSCTSSVGNLGSPKPEKRQANSPLPPTPKNSSYLHLSNSNLASSGSIQSGRNSAASVIECHGANAINSRHVSRENLSHTGDLMGKKTKDLEGMYAKVMKKNKLSNAPSQNTSPVPYRKSMNDNDRQSVFVSDPDIAREINLPEALSKSVHASPGKGSVKSAAGDNDYETIDKRRARSSSSAYDKKDPGYETIPGDRAKKHANSSRISAPPGIFSQKLSHHPAGIFPETSGKFTTNYGDNSEPGYESLPDQSLTANDPGYETVQQSEANKRKSTSDYDPNYEVLRPMNADNSSDHYEKVWDKPNMNANDGYSSIKPVKNKTTINSNEENATYCTIPALSSPKTPSKAATKPINHDYASISETKGRNYFKNNAIPREDDVYSSISSDTTSIIVVNSSGNETGKNDGYSTIQETRQQTATVTISTNNVMLASICSNLSDTKTITSPTTSDTSTSADNSSDPQISYNDLSPLTASASNYESLTGSESDPNYETVRYLDVKKQENPYEQLRNEKDSSPETSKPTRRRNGTPSMGNSPSGTSIGSVDETQKTSNRSTINANSESNDYFQV